MSRDAKTLEYSTKKKARPILFSSHIDSHIYAYYGEKLSELYEQQLTKRSLSDVVLAFRSLGKSNIHFANEAFAEIKKRGDCTAIALDVSGFFDNLDHELLKTSWANLLGSSKLPSDHYSVYRSLTKFVKVNKLEAFKALGISLHNPRKDGRKKLCEAKDFRKKIRKAMLLEINNNDFGIPQGSPISAILSNIYMLEFDSRCERLIRGLGGRYYRYCDDILLVVPSVDSPKVQAFVENELINLKLKANPNKTEKRTFVTSPSGLQSDKPLQYLGFTYDGKRILIRSASLSRYSDKMKRGVKLAKRTRDKRNIARKKQGQPSKPIYKKRLYGRYSHLGKRNFVRYGYRAADIMGSDDIRGQLKPLWDRLIREIET